MPLLAEKIREQFRRYSCNKLTLSAGIHIAEHDFPIHRGAIIAGDAEEKAKSFNSNGSSAPEKDAICFLDRPVRWETFSALKEIAYTLVSGMEHKNIPKSLLTRLNSINSSYKDSKKKLSKNKTLSKQQILQLAAYERWRWLSVYALGRFKKNNKEFVDEIEKIQELLAKDRWKEKTVPEAPDIIDMPVRWAELLTRKEE